MSMSCSSKAYVMPYMALLIAAFYNSFRVGGAGQALDWKGTVRIQHLLRKAAERSKETVWRRIGTLLDQVHIAKT